MQAAHYPTVGCSHHQHLPVPITLPLMRHSDLDTSYSTAAERPASPAPQLCDTHAEVKGHRSQRRPGLHTCFAYLILTLTLLAANLANTKWCKKPEKWPKPWQMGTHLRVLSKSYPMIPTWQCLDGFQKSCVLEKVASALEGLKTASGNGFVFVTSPNGSKT